MFTTAQLLILIVAVAGSGAMVGFMAWLIGRLRRLEGGGTADTGALAERLGEVQEELEAVHRAVARLEEHASFTARLLEGRPARESLAAESGEEADED